MFKITKENTTYSEADSAVDILLALKLVFNITLLVITMIIFILWEIQPIMVRLFLCILFVIVFLHFLQGKYKKVLQEHLEEVK